MQKHRFIGIIRLGLLLTEGAGRGMSAADPEIVGSMAFSNQVYQALLLLKTGDTNAYTIVTSYVGRIRDSAHSGMAAYLVPPTFEVTASEVAYSMTWCAAIIAHDSFHSKLYHDYLKGRHPGAPVPYAIWAGKTAEKRCMKHQLLVMKNIGASKWEIDHARKYGEDTAKTAMFAVGLALGLVLLPGALFHKGADETTRLLSSYLGCAAVLWGFFGLLQLSSEQNDSVFRTMKLLAGGAGIGLSCVLFRHLYLALKRFGKPE